MGDSSARRSQDIKIQKLAAKIEASQKLSGGHAVLVAVPAKRGGALAAVAGAMSGNVRNMQAMRDRSRSDVDRSASAGDVHKQIGDGSDFVLCVTSDDVRIIRLVAFGVMTGTPCVLEHSAIAGITVDAATKKHVQIDFHDGSALPFQVVKDPHRASLQKVARATWPVEDDPA